MFKERKGLEMPFNAEISFSKLKGKKFFFENFKYLLFTKNVAKSKHN